MAKDQSSDVIREIVKEAASAYRDNALEEEKLCRERADDFKKTRKLPDINKCNEPKQA